MTVVNNIQNSINKSRTGQLFFLKSFSCYDEEYVGKVLSDFCKQNELVRLSPGVFLKPLKSKFGIVYPPVSEIVEAIAKRDSAMILPAGNTALNFLGFSTQVPMNSEYITTGSARVLNIGKRTVKLKRSVPSNFAYKNKFIAVLVQALKGIGGDNITDEHLLKIRELLLKNVGEVAWKQDLSHAPAWIRKLILTQLKCINDEQMD